MFIGAPLPDLYDAYATKVKVQFERLVSKAALISPEGDLSAAPAAIPGSPHSEVGECSRALRQSAPSSASPRRARRR
eukprot:scaffold6554_cov65-Phaeocystis_antarctica.AAC.2